MIKFNLY